MYKDPSYTPEKIPQKPEDEKKPPPGTTTKQKPLGRIFRTLIVSLILSAGAFTAYSLLKTGPTAKRTPAVRRARLVETIPVLFSTHQITIEGMGTVQPAREIDLFPQVSGEIQWVNPDFIPGSYFEAHETLLQINPADYELIIQERQSVLAQANSNLKLEQGQQNVALQEFELLGESVREEDRNLVLRLPQLESVRAEVDKATAALEKARLDFERTTIKTPFKSMIQTQEVDLGASVTPATKLASLTGTDEYRVEVLIPVDQLEWISIPGPNQSEGSNVKIFDSAGETSGAYRTGKVIRLISTLEPEGQMARLLVSVPDPLSLNSDSPKTVPMLLIGTFVRVQIEGRQLTQVIAIQREWLRNNSTVWLMNGNNELEIRPVQIAYRDRDRVFVKEGLQEGERLVVTDLAAPVQGMPLRIPQNETAQPPA